MTKNVIVIPVSRGARKRTTEGSKPKKKVAAYCRVSTDSEEQSTSYEVQVEHYTSYINSKPDWILAGIYADDGISGTNTKKRDEFNRMIDDCMAGSIDMVITKSISRFARNTLDCLKYIRQLKDHQIPVFFEKENINTMDAKGEVLLTIMASLAQQESQSMSQNVRMGYQFRFQNGQVFVNTSRFLGYTKDDDGRLVIVPEEAEIVRRIFREYLEGASMQQIANGLEADGVLTGAGMERWHAGTIRGMLQNEKYMGDALLQKTYTVDFLSKKKVRNNGIAPQYYVENSHPAIIPKDLFMMTQKEIERRSDLHKEKRGYSGKYALTGIAECSHCGDRFRRIKWNNRGCRSTVWRCVNRVEKVSRGIECPARTVREEVLHEAVVDAINSMLELSDDFYDKYRQCLINALGEGNSASVVSIDERLKEVQRKLITLNDNDPEYDDVVDEIYRLREEKHDLVLKDAVREDTIRQADELMKFIKEQPSKITTFDDVLVRKLIEKVKISDENITVIFKTGYEAVIEK